MGLICVLDQACRPAPGTGIRAKGWSSVGMSCSTHPRAALLHCLQCMLALVQGLCVEVACSMLYEVSMLDWLWCMRMVWESNPDQLCNQCARAPHTAMSSRALHTAPCAACSAHTQFRPVLVAHASPGSGLALQVGPAWGAYCMWHLWQTSLACLLQHSGVVCGANSDQSQPVNRASPVQALHSVHILNWPPVLCAVPVAPGPALRAACNGQGWGRCLLHVTCWVGLRSMGQNCPMGCIFDNPCLETMLHFTLSF